MKNALTPLEPPFSQDVATVLQRYPQDRDGYILKLFRVFANSMRFLTSKGVSNLLDKDSPLSLRQREIVILRVTANRDCEYEWGVHVSTFAIAAKLTTEQVAATRLDDSSANCWSEEEATLIACVDEICAAATVSDAQLARFQTYWDAQQQLEILSLCGNYHLVCAVANTARLDNETGAATFPE